MFIINNKEIKEIFFDMDGVLFNYRKFFETISGKPMSYWSELSKFENKPSASIWFSENVGDKTNFFSSLEPLHKQHNQFIIKNLRNQGYKVSILSACSLRHQDEVAIGKKESLKKHYAHLFDNIHLVPQTKDKAEFANENTLLVDDTSEAIKCFTENGGSGILYSNAHQLSKILFQHKLI